MIKKIRIHEIFESIQGEGFNFGKPFIFVRFTGCNFDCEWCDQPTEINMEMEEEELVKTISEYGIKSVLFTGGEPTLQLTASLIEKLKNQNFYIAIETNGSMEIPAGVDYITVSPKLGRNTRVSKANEVRIPADSKDIKKYMEAKNKIRADRYFLSPIYIEAENRFDFETLSFIYDKLREENFHISIQLHKLMGVR